MRILLINTYDIRGGAARAAWRLFLGLLEEGHEVTYLVQVKDSSHPGIVCLPSPVTSLLNPVRPYIDFAIPFPLIRKRILFSTALLPDNLNRYIHQFNPDIVHLHWITGGFLKLETLSRINKPVVWTLHDMWAFTGGCHNSLSCTRYMEGCGRCPLLHSSRLEDLSRSQFRRKEKVYGRMKNLMLTAPSNWVANQVAESPLLGSKPVRVIGNGLDTKAFAPVNQSEARRKLGLPDNRKVILFGAIRATETPLKGFGMLVEAIRTLARRDLRLVVFGSDGPAGTDISGLEIDFMGRIDNDARLVELYSAADVVAMPSRQEVFGQAATEAMACGRPVVAFRTTGLTDIVVHRETGYLAEPFKTESLSEGLSWVMDDPERGASLGSAGRERVVRLFGQQVIARKFQSLYEEMIHGSGK